MKLEHLFSGVNTTDELINILESLEVTSTEVFINDYDSIPISKLRSIIIQSANDKYTPTQIYKSLNKFFCS